MTEAKLKPGEAAAAAAGVAAAASAAAMLCGTRSTAYIVAIAAAQEAFKSTPVASSHPFIDLCMCTCLEPWATVPW